VTVSWDLLLPTIVHRHDLACGLLGEIARQHQPGLGVLVYRDNLQLRGNASYAKWQALEEMSAADYTSFISDDDWIAPGFVARIMEALEGGPDCVGFRYRYTIDGEPGPGVVHSLRYSGWSGNEGGEFTRPIGHYNPVRRELALLAGWKPVQDADRHWAAALIASGQVRAEAFIDKELYYYQETGESWSRRLESWPEPLPADQIRPLPDYPWLTIRDEALA
jgi:hypothetical protein